MNITFIGGCMVTMKENYVSQFRDTFKQMLPQIELSINVVREWNIEYISKLVKKISYDSDVVIIQIGHLETNYRCKLIFKILKLLGMKPRNSGSTNTDYMNDLVITTGDNCFSPTWKFQLREYIKLIFYTLNLAKSMVGEIEFNQSVDKLLKETKECSNTKIMILSCFPKMGFLGAKLRKRYTEILHEKCMEYGVEYIDVYNLLQEKIPYIMADMAHINKAGHGIVADCIFNKVQSHISPQGVKKLESG